MGGNIKKMKSEINQNDLSLEMVQNIMIILTKKIKFLCEIKSMSLGFLSGSWSHDVHAVYSEIL